MKYRLVHVVIYDFKSNTTLRVLMTVLADLSEESIIAQIKKGVLLHKDDRVRSVTTVCFTNDDVYMEV